MGWPKKQIIIDKIDSYAMGANKCGFNKCLDEMTAELKKRAAVEEIYRICVENSGESSPFSSWGWRRKIAQAIHAHLVGDLE